MVPEGGGKGGELKFHLDFNGGTDSGRRYDARTWIQ